MIFTIAGTFLFSIISAAFSFLVIRKYESIEKSELMSYLLIFVWGAFLFGMYIARTTAEADAGIFR